MNDEILNISGEWEHWSNRVLEYDYPTDSIPEYSSILVPNVDNIRTKYLIDVIAKQHKVSVSSFALLVQLQSKYLPVHCRLFYSLESKVPAKLSLSRVTRRSTILSNT